MAEQKQNPKTAAIMAERKANTARITTQLEAEGYHAEDATVSIVKANVMACVTALPVAIVLAVVFHLLYPDIQLGKAFIECSLWLTPLMLLSIPVHEGLHGCGWVISCKQKWKSIQFGVMWDSLTPYCHCREAVSVVRYYIGLLLPFTVLGVIIGVISLLTGNALLMYLSAYNLFIAGGDTTIAWIILKYLGEDAQILDHPDQCGAVAFVK